MIVFDLGNKDSLQDAIDIWLPKIQDISDESNLFRIFYFTYLK